MPYSYAPKDSCTYKVHVNGKDTVCWGQHYAAFMRINGFGNLANTKLVQLLKTLGDCG